MNDLDSEKMLEGELRLTFAGDVPIFVYKENIDDGEIVNRNTALTLQQIYLELDKLYNDDDVSPYGSITADALFLMKEYVLQKLINGQD